MLGSGGESLSRYQSFQRTALEVISIRAAHTEHLGNLWVCELVIKPSEREILVFLVRPITAAARARDEPVSALRCYCRSKSIVFAIASIASALRNVSTDGVWIADWRFL